MKHRDAHRTLYRFFFLTITPLLKTLYSSKCDQQVGIFLQMERKNMFSLFWKWNTRPTETPVINTPCIRFSKCALLWGGEVCFWVATLKKRVRINIWRTLVAKKKEKKMSARLKCVFRWMSTLTIRRHHDENPSYKLILSLFFYEHTKNIQGSTLG